MEFFHYARANRAVFAGAFRHLILVAALLPAFGQDGRTVRVAGGMAPPLAYRDQSGEPIGFFVETMAEAARRAGLQFEWHFHSEGMESALRQPTVDLWAAATPTTVRRRLFHFSTPWWVYDYHLLVAEEHPVRTDLDLSGRIIVHRNSPPSEVNWESGYPGARFEIERSIEEAGRLLCQGEADALLLNNIESNNFLLRRPAACRDVSLRTLSQPTVVANLAIVAPFEKRQLAERLRGSVEQMTVDGTLAEIAARYPGVLSRNAKLMLHSGARAGQRRLVQFALVAAAVLFLVIGGGFLLLRSAKRRARTAIESANTALRAKDEFVAKMSHEIRTPMNALLGYLEMLLGTPLRADQRHFGSEVSRAASTLLGMLNDVLDYAKLRSDGVSLRREAYDPTRVIDDAAATLLIRAEEKGLDLIVRIGPEVPEKVIGDAVGLRRIIVNLLSNGVKFSEHGFVRVDLQYEAKGNDQGVLILTVVDTGPGISEEKRQAIFESFIQAGSTDQSEREGAGLGLAIVAGLVELMEGSIDLKSAVGVGSRFTIRIPAPAAEPRRGWLIPHQQQRATLLLLVKPSANTKILEEYLSGVGLELRHATSEKDLVAMLEKACLAGTPVWGILLQSQCLESTVHEFAFRVRAVPNGRGVAIILTDSLQSLVELPPEDRESLDCILTWPFGGRTMRQLFGNEHREEVGGSHGKVTVLVVDDNAINRRVATSLLERLGCEADSASNGQDAIDCVARRKYRLVLMDIQMPVLDGYEAARQIRLLEPPRSRTLIYGLTAAPEEEARPKCMAAGMDGCLFKPVDLEIMRQVVQRAYEAQGSNTVQ